jgi:hypothetical protein
LRLREQNNFQNSKKKITGMEDIVQVEDKVAMEVEGTREEGMALEEAMEEDPIPMVVDKEDIGVVMLNLVAKVIMAMGHLHNGVHQIEEAVITIHNLGLGFQQGQQTIKLSLWEILGSMVPREKLMIFSERKDLLCPK